MKTRLQAAALAAALFIELGNPGLSAQTICTKIEGAKLVETTSTPGTMTGSISGGGILTGATQTVFTGGPMSTPSPTVISVTGNWTVTTNQGQLKTRNTFLYDFATGSGTALAVIDGASSTGRFAGASGILYLSVKDLSQLPYTVAGSVTGEVWLDKNNE